MSKEYIKAQTPLPAYFPYPKFLLQMSLSHTARLTYVLLLDRMTLSQKNGWVDVQGRAYVLYPLAGLAEDLQSSISSVTRALRELEAARLIERRSNGFSKPNQVFLSFPSTAQKLQISAHCWKPMPQTTRNCALWTSLWMMATLARTLNGLRSKGCFRNWSREPSTAFW